ncbi:MAG: amino acid adenylation domain-containing protein, partial [Planctomycetes bacterium]|nr:amino acid adenylation domain-containing protein [Planctomycetota bacterium]
TGDDNASLVTDNSLVGICVERSLEMVIGLLGILKAGGAYVPLDPDYPLSRLQFMLEDSEVDGLLSQSHLLERLPLSKSKVVCLDSEWQQIEDYSDEKPVRQSGPENLAYVIYTSGSTGNPKGVMVEHSSLTNLVYWHNRKFNVSQTDNATLLASIAFDASGWELWPYLSVGACVFPVKTEKILSSSTKLKAWLEEKKITITFIPTPLVEKFLSETWKTTTLRMVLTGGEALLTYLPSESYFEFYNNYGPTENTVVTTSGEVPRATNTDNPKFPSIGTPIDNTNIYIFDANHNQTPPGIPGELCIAGTGLARGYLNRPELTAQKFIEIEIFGKRERVYKTGDLARWLPDGNLEFLGRLDHQVKLRGFRIELSEIEVNLSQHEAVKEAVVALYNQENNPGLSAYVTLAMPINDVTVVLRDWLKAR